MKRCPKCQRTFEDIFSFCLEDGTVLSQPFGLNETENISGGAPKTEVLPPGGAKKQFLKPLSIGLLGFLTILLAAAAIYYTNRPRSEEAAQKSFAGNSNLAVGIKPNVSVSPTITAVPASENNSNKNAANANLETNSVNAAPSPDKTPENETPDGVLKKMKQGMSYSAARKMLMKSGWQAVSWSPNRDLFGQEDYIVNKLKFYEMEACAGTGAGYCRFQFRDVNRRKLIVVTVNNEEGMSGGPRVENWSFEK